MHTQEQNPVPHDRLKEYTHRILVAGSRGFTNYPFFCELMDDIVTEHTEGFAIVTGVAPSGPDEMVVRWCKEHQYPWAEFPPEWDNLSAQDAVIKVNRSGKEYNARAGFDRNVKMADYSTHVVVFWDGSSPGTKHMREHATLRALPLVTILVDLTKEKQE